MLSRNERKVENQKSFRDANERFESLASDIVRDGELVPFLCECANETCRGRVAMNLNDYGVIHADRELFVILPGHERTEGEEVIERYKGYEIARKPSE